jgi:hypothetical protein
VAVAAAEDSLVAAAEAFLAEGHRDRGENVT